LCHTNREKNHCPRIACDQASDEEFNEDVFDQILTIAKESNVQAFRELFQRTRVRESFVLFRLLSLSHLFCVKHKLHCVGATVGQGDIMGTPSIWSLPHSLPERYSNFGICDDDSRTGNHSPNLSRQYNISGAHDSDHVCVSIRGCGQYKGVVGVGSE
jgi:hypothetical protein